MKGEVRQLVLPGPEQETPGSPEAIVVRDRLAWIGVVPRGDRERGRLDRADVRHPAGPRRGRDRMPAERDRLIDRRESRPPALEPALAEPERREELDAGHAEAPVDLADERTA